MGERVKLERRDERVYREGNGERREDKGERERKGVGEGRVGYPLHPSNSPQYGLIPC